MSLKYSDRVPKYENLQNIMRASMIHDSCCLQQVAGKTFFSKAEKLKYDIIHQKENVTISLLEDCDK